MLLLLEPANENSSPDTPFIELCGSRWVLNEYANSSHAPAYTCISYAWMKNTKENPLDAGKRMSARTIPVIETTIKTSRSPENWSNVQISLDPQKDTAAKSEAIVATQAFWIDALCVPQQEPARTLCLQRMGEIYSSAWQVFVVLPESCSPVFRQIKTADCIDSTALFIFESDEWITRAWTYQETVNSRALYFIGQNDEGVIVSGTDFLNIVLTANDKCRKTHENGVFTWNEQHPNLDNLEILIADYRIAACFERSAYQVMVAIHPRLAERDDDYFYAMIGAITKTTLDIDGVESLSPSEYFMRVCEAKGDYSFIYNIGRRNEALGKRWRPIEGRFQPVVPAQLIFGDGQSGCLKPTHIKLENMCRFGTGSMSPDGLKATLAYLPKDRNFSSSHDIAEAILDRLRKKGFSGCGEYFELESGFFFPQSMPVRSEVILFALSPSVRWEGGCPGLLLCSNGTDIDDFLCVGAFVGRVPKKGEESICVG